MPLQSSMVIPRTCLRLLIPSGISILPSITKPGAPPEKMGDGSSSAFPHPTAAPRRCHQVLGTHDSILPETGTDCCSREAKKGSLDPCKACVPSSTFRQSAAMRLLQWRPAIKRKRLLPRIEQQAVLTLERLRR